MKTIKVTKDVAIRLMDLCGKIQTIKNTRISPSSAISVLLGFSKKHPSIFNVFIREQKVRSFPLDYEEKIKAMESAGMPISRERT